MNLHRRHVARRRSVLFGSLLNAVNITANPQAFTDAVNLTALRMTLLGVGVFFAQYISNSIPMYTSERQLRQLRHSYMAALLRQDMAWWVWRRGCSAVRA